MEIHGNIQNICFRSIFESAFAFRFVPFVQAMFPRHGVLKDVDHSGGLGVSSPKQFQEHLIDTSATRATHCSPLTHFLLYHLLSSVYILMFNPICALEIT